MDTTKTTPARKTPTRKVKPVEVAQDAVQQAAPARKTPTRKVTAAAAVPVAALVERTAPAVSVAALVERTAPAATTARKAPTVVGSLDQAVAAAAEAGRKRPVLARNQAGELVTCCRSTARKNGWDVVQKLYKRVRKTKTAASDLI